MLLYKLNFANGKSYIGQTLRTLETRIAQHNRAANAGSLLAVHCAWRSHGAPTVEVLGRYETPDALHDAEIAAITAHGTLSPNGYNIGLGGETAPSKNPDVAAKIAAKAKGRLHTEETRAGMSEGLEARWQDAGYRQKVSDGLKASWTPEKRAAVAERNRARAVKRQAEGWTMPQSQRDAIRASRAHITDETRAKMSASAKARVREKFSPESCARIAERTRAAWADPEITAKRLAAIKTARAAPEVAAKQRAGAVDSWKNPETRAKRIAAIRESHRRRKAALQSQGDHP